MLTPQTAHRAIVALGALAVMLCWMLAGRNDIWFDEFFTYETARLSWHGIVVRTLHDVHPPLFYFLLKPCIFWGFGEWLLRAPSGLFQGASVVVFCLATAPLFGRRTSVLLGVFLVFSPLLLRFGSEARQYALMSLAQAVALLAIVRLWLGEEMVLPRRLAWLAAYAAALLCGLYTHNLFTLEAAWLAGLLVLAALAQPRAKRLAAVGAWLAVHAAVGACYFPWLAHLRMQAEVNKLALEWMELPQLFHVRRMLTMEPFGWDAFSTHPAAAWLSVAQYFGNLLLLPLAALSARRLGARARWALAGLVMGAAACTAVAYVTSYYYVRLLFVERFATIVAPVILLCLAIIASRPPRHVVLRGLCWAMVLMNVVGMAWHNVRIFSRPYHVQNRTILGLVRAEPGERQPEVYIAFVSKFEEEVFRFYRDRLAPDLPIHALSPESRIAPPTPEAPLWIVVTRNASRARTPAAQVARAILISGQLARDEVAEATFQAFLVEQSGVFEQVNPGEPPPAQP